MQISPISPDGFQALDSNCPDSEQLHVFSGNLVRTIHLFTIPTLGRPLTFSLYHNSRNITGVGDVGIGWRHNVQAQLSRANSTATLVALTDETGRQRDFELVAGNWQLKDDSLFAQLTLIEVGGGLWRLTRQPDGKTMEFQEQAGTPIVARLVRVTDSSDNPIQYVYTGTELTQVLEPVSGRFIKIEWTSGKISAVEDMEHNRYLLTYTGDLLTTLEIPGGCLVDFTYHADNTIASRTSAGHTTLYTHDVDGRLIQIEGPLEGASRPTATWQYPTAPVNEVANLSPISSPGTGEFIPLTQVFFTTARGKVWEYRFLPSSMLWRQISPLQRHWRNFYDDRQNLLYSSLGYPRKNIDDTTDTGNHDHPRDNFNNLFSFNVWSENGTLLQDINSNGMVTARTYASSRSGVDPSRLLSVYPGQAHYGLGGDWRPHFCKDGYLFCAHQSNGDNVEHLPAYVTAVTPGATVVPTPSSFAADNLALLSTQVLDGVVSSDGRFSPTRRIGRWTSATQTLDFQIELTGTQAFNLSLYTNSLDQLTATSNVLDYPEFFGRDIEFSVTDLRGTQSFHVTQNASGVWATFPVVGDATHPIQVTAVCPQSEHRPSVSALAFDPFEDRRVKISYSPEGFLAKVTEPTSDPNREVADEYLYNGDGTTRQSSKTHRLAGALLESRTTKMFYENVSKDLTRIEDPLNQAAAPTLMDYDQNSNMVRVVDQDLKEILLGYDYRRRVIRIENGLAEVTLLTFDGRGLLVLIRDANSRDTQLVHTPSRKLWKIINAKLEVTEFSYFQDGLLKSIKDAAGNEVFCFYSDDDELIRVEYPQTEVVLPDFSRQNLTPQLRMAYDVWNRLAAVTSPNGNLDDTANINLVGALNLLRNGGAEFENGTFNQVPVGWEEGHPAGFVQNSVRSSAQSLTGDYSFPLSVPDTLAAGESYDWVQRRPGGSPGGRYLMKGFAKTDLATNFKLRAVVREFSATLTEQTGQVALPADTWTEASARVDLPGDAQVSQQMPALHQFRASIEKPPSGTAHAYLDELKVLALSQLAHYDGEYPSGSTGPDGARGSVVRDRFGRVRRIIDPVGRTVDITLDVLGRVLEVRDTQGLFLRYLWNFLGDLVQFIDSRLKETGFVLDDLSRVIQIIQPDPAQTEDFTYTPAGDLATYKNCRNQERQFFYNLAHRLIRIDYILTPNPTESVSINHDSVGNVLTFTERNADQLLMGYDVLNRLKTTVRKSVTGAQWALGNEYDSRGNRTKLRRLPVYGIARYGLDRYGTGAAIFTAHHNALNLMDSLKDSLDNESTFGFDPDSRLVEVNHPTTELQTRHRYDLVGKLLESRVTLNSNELWDLGYSYNLAADRLRQTSRYSGGGNCFEYLQDDSGRLVQETVNRWVTNSVGAWATGSQRSTCFDLDTKLRLVNRADDFQNSYLDLQRWELAFSEPVASAIQVRQGQGLSWATSAGGTLRNGRHLPAGTPYDSSNASNDYPYISGGIQVSDTVGWFEGRILMRHRLPLEGAFDIEVAVSEFDLFDCSIGLGVTRDRFHTADGASRYPTTFGVAVDPNGTDIVLQNVGGLQAQFNAQSLTGVTATKVRLKRYLDGATWKIQAFYHNGTSWVTDASWTTDFSGQTVFPYLHLSGKVGHLRWTDFLDTVGPTYPVSVMDTDQAVNQTNWPHFESTVYDAGHSVSWTRIAWAETLTANTAIRFQVAASENEAGPWSYVGSDGTSNTYFTTAAGQALPTLTGRYGRFRVFLTSTDGLATPELSDVQISHSGTSGSSVTRNTYDPAGNITEVRVITDAGTEIQTRLFNNLNQIVSRSGGWTHVHDLDGNLVEMTNGTAVGNEKWEFTSDENSRLTQVKKGIYAAGALLVNVFTVIYRYDDMGRMILRQVLGDTPTTFTWDAFDCVLETTGASRTEYLVPWGMIYSFIRDGQHYCVHADALGSVRMVTDAGGAVVARLEFSAWGETLAGSFDNVPGGIPFGFVGAVGVRTDATTGLIWMRNRWFLPSLQRFVSRDVLDSVNRYAYAANSPQNLIDTTGLEAVPPGGWQLGSSGIYKYAPSSYHNYGPGLPYHASHFAKSTWVGPGGNATGVASGIWVGPGGMADRVALQATRNAYPPGIADAIAGSAARNAVQTARDCDCPPSPPGVSIKKNMKEMRAILTDPQRNTSHKMIIFYNLVNYGGTWDYKELSPKQLEDFGNFHYGAAGHALGLSDQLLLRAAGWAQIRNHKLHPDQTPYDPAWGRPNQGPPYGDQPHDQVQINLGIEYARKWEREGCPDTP